MQQKALLFDHLVGAGEQCRRHVKAERLRGRQIDDEIELGRLLDRNIGRLRPAQNLVDIIGGAPEQVQDSLVRRTSDLPLRRTPADTCIVGSRAASAKVLMRTRWVFTSGSPTT